MIFIMRCFRKWLWSDLCLILKGNCLLVNNKEEMVKYKKGMVKELVDHLINIYIFFNSINTNLLK